MHTKEIIIIGSGGHAKVLIDAILSSKIYKIKGILDDKVKKVLGYPVIGSDELLSEFKGKYLALGIGSIKSSKKRKEVYDRIKIHGFKFPVIIHKDSYISKTARLEDGVQVMAGAIINPEAKIGENAIINTGAIIEHDCIIGAHSHISLNAVLAGNVTVGECSHIGMGARVLQGVNIGNNVTVGAGAVVIRDVKNNKTVVGMPAREIDE